MRVFVSNSIANSLFLVVASTGRAEPMDPMRTGRYLESFCPATTTLSISTKLEETGGLSVVKTEIAGPLPPAIHPNPARSCAPALRRTLVYRVG
ncbi:hypothetical protein F5146DRAFT_1063354 [Armillaria mellea]|nr:hypothetical protein F5146DRAFT_1063354 [Armillaria mellea]